MAEGVRNILIFFQVGISDSGTRNLISQTRYMIPQTMYMNRYCILRTFMIRDRKYRHIKKKKKKTGSLPHSNSAVHVISSSTHPLKDLDKSVTNLFVGLVV